jgi:acetyl esterase/lipase
MATINQKLHSTRHLTERSGLPNRPPGTPSNFRIVVSIGLAILAITALTAFRLPPSSPSEQITEGYRAPSPAAVYRGLAYGPREVQRLDLYIPRTPPPHKLIVFAHTGGWCCGDRSAIPLAFLDALASGWAIASIDYQLFTETTSSFPTNVHDFKRATRWLRWRSATYRLNPNMVVAAGASAGGHLAALAAVTAGRILEPSLTGDLAQQRADYQGVAAMAGPVNLVRFAAGTNAWSPLAGGMLGCGQGCTFSQLAAASPLHQLTSAAPPMYLAYGGLDGLVSPLEGVDLERAYQSRVPFGDRMLWLDINTKQDHNLDLYGINIVALRRFLSGLVANTFREPAGNFESVVVTGRTADVTGWAIDPDTAEPIAVHAYVDGRWGGASIANQSRPDVGRAFPGYGDNHGFRFTLPDQTPGPHTVCLYAINVGPGSVNPSLGCRTFILRSGNPIGNFESVVVTGRTADVTGWAIDPDTAEPIAVHAYVDGRWGGASIANQSRPDVGRAFPGYGDNHGFRFTLPDQTPGPHTVCLYAINVGPGSVNPSLGCRTFALTTPDAAASSNSDKTVSAPVELTPSL